MDLLIYRPQLTKSDGLRIHAEGWWWWQWNGVQGTWMLIFRCTARQFVFIAQSESNLTTIWLFTTVLINQSIIPPHVTCECKIFCNLSLTRSHNSQLPRTSCATIHNCWSLCWGTRILLRKVVGACSHLHHGNNFSAPGIKSFAYVNSCSGLTNERQLVVRVQALFWRKML